MGINEKEHNIFIPSTLGRWNVIVEGIKKMTNTTYFTSEKTNETAEHVEEEEEESSCMDMCWKTVSYMFLYNGAEYLYKLPGGELASLLHAYHNNNRSWSTVITKEPIVNAKEQCDLVDETKNKNERFVVNVADEDRC